MAPKQKTFELIPTTVGLHGLGRDQSAPIMSKPPMTTKQAKKAYRKANKGPKLSKAEQRRIELMEQDRIRKEFEKERNQARARTARDRKKAKQDKEKEERKRKGLPLVDVHPSQDTIARFVRAPKTVLPNPILEATREEDTESATEIESAVGEEEPEQQKGDGIGNKESGDEDKENVDPAHTPEERGAKRQRLSRDKSVSIGGSQHPADPVARLTAQAIASEPVSRATSVDIDDPVNQDLIQEQLIADVILASSRNTEISHSSPPEQRLHAEPPRVPSPVLPTEAKGPSHPVHLKRQEPTARPQLVCQEDLARPQKSFQKSASPHLPAVRPRLPLQSPGPQIPIFKTSAAPSNYHSGKPKFLPKHLRTPVYHQGLPKPPDALPGNVMPTSTQLFLLDHVDDFFPSPSQEANELLEGRAKMPARTSVSGVSRPITPVVPERSGENASPMATLVKNPGIVAPTFDFPMSTQDFTFSSQDLRDIETPSKPRRQCPSRGTSGIQGANTQGTDKESKHPDGMNAGQHADASRGPSQAVPTISPPKKRMFGSSGPGAEVLVAMERSYQQSRREDWARQEERRAQERMATETCCAPAVAVEGPNMQMEGEQAAVLEGNGADTVASQETDYGDLDIGGDVLALLEDTTWLDDDLDDCL